MDKKLPKLIVDTDMAFDDWVALLYLMSSAELLAVTISGTGESHPQPGAKNFARLKKIASSSRIPTGVGRTQPFLYTSPYPWFIRYAMDLMLLLPLPMVKNKVFPKSLRLLKKTLSSAKSPVKVVTMGPATNLAELILWYPKLKNKISEIIMMGGAIDVPGNLKEINPQLNPYAEWNIYIDPLAAQVVWSSGIPVSLVPLDVTNTLPVTDGLLHQLSISDQTSVTEFVSAELERLRSLLGETKLFMWDLVAAMVATHPELATITKMKLKISSDPEQIGRTIRSDDGLSVNVVTQVNKPELESIFIKVLANRTK